MSALGPRARAVLAADYCPLIVRWNPLRPATASERIRHVASRSYFRRQPAVLRLGLNGLLWLTWPLRALLLILRYTSRCGATVAAETGRGRLRQAADQARLAIVEFLPAHVYYRYALYRERHGRETTYLHQPEAGALFQRLNRERHAAVLDKCEFFSMCQTHDLPTPTLTAVARGGSLEMLGPRLGSLFVKPVSGSRGEHSSAWSVETDGEHYRASDGRTWTWSELKAQLEQQSRARPYLVQPLLANDGRVADLSTGPLAVARVVTGRLPSGDVECIAAVFRMPSTVSRFGLFSAIDLESGSLGSGDSCRLNGRRYDRHPDTGATVTGRVLPGWRAVQALGTRAHAMFPGYVFLGWDIALTPDGPVLLEANEGWDVISVQRPHGRSLMQTRFAAICMRWLDPGHD